MGEARLFERLQIAADRPRRDGRTAKARVVRWSTPGGRAALLDLAAGSVHLPDDFRVFSATSGLYNRACRFFSSLPPRLAGALKRRPRGGGSFSDAAGRSSSPACRRWPPTRRPRPGAVGRRRSRARSPIARHQVVAPVDAGARRPRSLAGGLAGRAAAGPHVRLRVFLCACLPWLIAHCPPRTFHLSGANLPPAPTGIPGLAVVVVVPACSIATYGGYFRRRAWAIMMAGDDGRLAGMTDIHEMNGPQVVPRRGNQRRSAPSADVHFSSGSITVENTGRDDGGPGATLGGYNDPRFLSRVKIDCPLQHPRAL